MDDVDILRELLRSVYLTGRQKDALRRVIGLVSRSPRRESSMTIKVTGAGTATLRLPFSSCGGCSGCLGGDVCEKPLLGPGDAE